MRPTAVATRLLIVTALAVAGCAETDTRAPSVPPAQQSDASRDGRTSVGDVPLGLEISPEIEPDGRALAALKRDARRFAASLTVWLYGDRGRLEVEALAPETRQQLAEQPPFIPVDQRGTGAGHVARVDVALQTPTTGVVAVTIADSRTSYRVPATFERHGHGWRVVHLNTH